MQRTFFFSHEFVLVHRDSGMVVKPLGRKHLGQITLAASGLLQLGALVLEPDLDLGLVQSKLVGQLLPPILVQVPVVLELLSKLSQLL